MRIGTLCGSASGPIIGVKTGEGPRKDNETKIFFLQKKKTKSLSRFHLKRKIGERPIKDQSPLCFFSPQFVWRLAYAYFFG